MENPIVGRKELEMSSSKVLGIGQLMWRCPGIEDAKVGNM